MKRNDIYKEIEQVAGFVPSFMKRLPDFELEHQWRLFRHSLEVEGPIPPKFRELTGVAVASALQCPYCIHAHTEFARVFGASDAEVEQAVRAGMHTAGWSTYIAGLGTDLDDFKKEINRVCDHMKKQR